MLLAAQRTPRGGSGRVHGVAQAELLKIGGIHELSLSLDDHSALLSAISRMAAGQKTERQSMSPTMRRTSAPLLLYLSAG